MLLMQTRVNHVRALYVNLHEGFKSDADTGIHVERQNWCNKAYF